MRITFLNFLLTPVYVICICKGRRLWNPRHEFRLSNDVSTSTEMRRIFRTRYTLDTEGINRSIYTCNEMSVSMSCRETFDHGNVQINRTFPRAATREIIYFMTSFHGLEHFKWLSPSVPRIIVLATRSRGYEVRSVCVLFCRYYSQLQRKYILLLGLQELKTFPNFF